jgi:hypothetical protein
MRLRADLAAMRRQAPVIAYCFDLHPKMHPNLILRDFGQTKLIARTAKSH